MKYNCTIEIERPRDVIIPLFEDTDRMGEWQEGLVSFEHKSGTPGTVGSTAHIQYKMGKREITMVETMEEYNLPDSMVTIYEADKVWNRNENYFVDLGDKTRWDMNCEFKCSGFMSIMAAIMPGMFRKQTMKMMTSFKAFAERQ